jgi:hypothetical protein
MHQPQELWGPLKGDIYKDFALRYPACLLTGPRGDRGDALPIVTFWVKWSGLKRRYIRGRTADGEFECDLVPVDRAILGWPTLVGDLRCGGRNIGLATIGPSESMLELAYIRSSADDWSLSLHVDRKYNAVSEGDAHLVDRAVGEVVRIPRRDSSWAEEIRSGLGFGRARRGHFLGAAETSLGSGEKRLALLFLLICYFQLLELPFNTDTSSS